MSISYQEALSQLATLTENGRIATQQELRSLASSVSVFADGNVTVLYGGTLSSGDGAGGVVKAMAANDSSLRVITNTQARLFLEDFRFQQAIADSFGVSADQVGIRGTPANLFLEGTDGLWGDTSVRFVQETVGEVRILTESPDPTRILYARELPALADRLRDTTSITSIDGISRDDLLKIIAPASLNDVDKALALRNSILNNAITQTHFTKPALGNYGGWLHLAPDGLTGILDNLSAAEQKAWQDLTRPFDVPRVATRALSKLGVIGGIVTFALMTNQASAAELAGDHEGAKQIVTEWGLDIAGSTAGQAIGAAAGAAALTALAAVGVVFTAPVAGALVIGAALIGGLFGGDAAQGIFDLTKDADDNGKLDLFDRLTTLLFGDNYTLTSPLPGTLDGGKITLDATFSREEMVAAARTDIAWRYALRELNAFVIPNISYAQHNADGSLNLYDPATGQGEMTDLYLADRAAMLTWKIRYDKGFRDDDDAAHVGGKPYFERWDTGAVKGDWDFIDFTLRQTGGAALKLSINGRDDGGDNHRIVFGGDANESLDGAGNTDHLYGNAGADTLTGKGGNDYLEGGSGNDTYIFATGDGTDTLLDTDGLGSIVIDGITLTGGALVDGTTNLWKNTAQGITYTLKGSGASQILLISKDGSADGIRVQGWQAGQLGLAMAGVVAPPATTTITGADGYSDVLRGTAAAEHILGLSGNDLVNGAGGDDRIEGGIGDDLIAGGAGSDLIHGGAGKDAIFSAVTFGAIAESGTWQAPAGVGPVWSQGRAWGIYDNPDGARVVSIGASGGLGAAYTPGHFVDGDTGQDSAPDIVFAGDDDDIVVGGLGDDYIDGGANNDVLWGHGGNDVIDGGDHNDQINGDGILPRAFTRPWPKASTATTCSTAARAMTI